MTPEFDVIIVGTGISGAIVASGLSESGLNILMLEAGPELGHMHDHVEQYYSAASKTPDAPWPSFKEADRPTVLDMAFADSWKNNPEHHLIQKGKLPFSSTYERGAGGTVNHWLGTCLRFLPSDFRLWSDYKVPGSLDWPISYDDLEPWYSKAEWELGVSGNHAEWDDYFGAHRSKAYPMPAIAQSYLDQYVNDLLHDKEIRGQNLQVFSTPQARNSRPYQNRPPCMGNTSCVPICPIQAKYDPTVHLHRALSANTPSQIRYRSVAYKLQTENSSDKISKILYKDWSGDSVVEREATAKVFVICANAIETPRLLLNSPWKIGLNGEMVTISNSSGQVGQNLMDHIICLGWGLTEEPVYPYRGPLSTSGIGTFRDGKERCDRSAYRIEIGNDGWSWPAISPYKMIHEMTVKEGLYGDKLRAAVRDQMTRQIRIAAEVEALPASGNRVILSGEHSDVLGIPKPEIWYEISEYTKKGFAESFRTIKQIFQHLGVEEYTEVDKGSSARFEFEGEEFQYRGAGHIMGTYRMGHDPMSSVVDAECRCHDHENLFLLGSGVFPSSATANPTLTIAALTLRAVETIRRDFIMSDRDVAANEMREVLNRWREVAVNERRHQNVNVLGKPVSWWFDTNNASTEEFMSALANDPELVVPGKLSASKLNTVYLQSSRRMARELAVDVARIKEWIKQGAPVPQTDSDVNQPDMPPDDKPPESDGTVRMVPVPTTDEEKEAFFKIANIEDFPEFRATANQLAKRYLSNANYNADKFYNEFEYTEKDFDERMQAIYDAFLPGMYTPHPFDSQILEYEGKKYAIGKASDAVVIDSMRQRAPFNLMDGVWLQNILSAGPSDEVQSRLFDIWADEVGKGEVEENHSNVYDNLLKSVGEYLPPVTSREFLDIDVADGAWTAPSFQMCMGLFPQEFFPELLGMTLLLEWEATPTLMPAVRLLENRGFNPLFYQLHVAIDNISEGHGAMAKEAVKIFLEEKREEGGEKAVQQNWKRIWNGYVTWATAGFAGVDRDRRRLLIDKIQLNKGTPDKPDCWPDIKEFYSERMIKLLMRKAPYASKVHGTTSIGGVLLNSLFDDPELLMKKLREEGYINPDHPRDSRLFKLMKFEGPMYRVFSEEEQDVILDWAESLRSHKSHCVDPLPNDGDGPADDWPDRMAALIVQYSPQAKLEHGGIQLTKTDGTSAPLSELFDQPNELMAALVLSGWVSPGNPNRSMFLTRIIENGGPMNGVFKPEEVLLVRKWIEDGAKLPKSVDAALLGVLSLESTATPTSTDPSVSFARKRHLIGMGSVH